MRSVERSSHRSPSLPRASRNREASVDPRSAQLPVPGHPVGKIRVAQAVADQRGGDAVTGRGASLLGGASALALLTAVSGVPAQAQSLWNTTTGNWSNAANWTPNGSPNSTSTSASIINGGTADVDGGFTVNNLTIGTTSGAGTASAVSILNNNFLTVAGNIVNDTTLLINGTNNQTQLRLNGGATVQLSGGGVVDLAGSGNNLIYDAAAGTGKLVNVNNSIIGAGNLGGGLMALDNQAKGIINGTVPGSGLTLQSNSAGFTNEGLIEATLGSGIGINGGSLTQTGGTLLATGANSTVVLYSSATVAGGTLATANGGSMSTQSGQTATLSNLTVSSGSTYTGQNNTNTYLVGTITNNGTLALAGTNNATEFRVQGGQTLTLQGSGVVSMTGGNNYILDADSSTGKLVNVNNTIEGGGNIGNGQMSMDNQAKGVINATAAGGLTLQPNSAGFTNEGLIESTLGSGIGLNGGSLTQTGGTLLASGTGSTVVLYNSAAVKGGTLTTTGAGSMYTQSGQTATLSNVTVSSGSTYTGQNNSTTYLAGTITNNGTLALEGTNNTTEFRVQGGQTLTLQGGGVVNLAGTGDNYILDADSSTGKLVNVNNTIQGTGNIGNAQMTMDNQASGIINANNSAHGLTLQPNGSGFSNEGLMEATGGGGLGLQGGSFTQSSTGTILASGTGSAVGLAGSASVSGGTLTTTGGGSMYTAGGQIGTLSNLTLSSGSTYTTQNNATTYLAGTIVNQGTFVIAATNNGTSMQFADGSTLTGGGKIAMADSINSLLWGHANTGTETLTNVNNTIAGSGQVGFSNSLEIINQAGGTFNATGTSVALIISPTVQASVTTPNGGGFVNKGLLEATGPAGLELDGGHFNNAGGQILATGTSIVSGNPVGNDVYLTANVTVTGGTLTSNGGAVLSTISGQTANLDATVAGGITLNGTYITPNNATTTINGTFHNNGLVQLNGLNNGTFLQLGDGSTLTGGGTIALSDSAQNLIFGIGNSGTTTVTNVNNTIQGSGTLGYSNAIEFINQKGGVINATGTSAALILQPDGIASLVSANGGGFVNKGLMEATNTAGLVLLGGQFNNNGGTILASGAGNGVYLENNVVVSGGTLGSTGGGNVQTVSGQTATLDGTSQGAITLAGTYVGANNSTTFMNGTVNNTGPFDLNASNNTTELRFSNGTTLTGGGTITLTDSANNLLFGTLNSGAETVTNVNNTIKGSGTFGFSNGVEFINQKGGVINATGTSAPLIMQPATDGPTITANDGGFVNQGLMEATNTAGLVLARGQFNNNGGTILASGAGVGVYLQGNVVVSGGLLESANGGNVQTVSGQTATLDGTSQGAITLGGTYVANNNSSTFLNGTINNTGQFQLNGSNNNTQLRIADGTTLTGGGMLTLNGSANNLVYGVNNSGVEVLTNANHTINGSGTLGFSNSIGIVNGGTINGSGTSALVLNPSVQIALASGIVNQAAGVIEGSGAGGLVIAQGSVSNLGTMQALNGSSLTYNSSVTNQNASAGTLTGGTWAAIASGGGATLSATGGPITTDAATITLSGIGSVVEFTNGTTVTPIQNSLTSIASTGVLNVLNSQNYTTTNNIANAGQLNLGGGTFTSNALTNTGLTSGFGTVTQSGGSQLSNSGSVVAAGGTLKLTEGVAGTTSSTLQISTGAGLDLSSATAGSTVGTLTHNGTSLALGTQNVTVSQDYTNAAFGTGNSFNAHANVTGTGKILAAGTGLALSVSGSGITNGTSATPTLALGNVHVGSGFSGTFNVDWAGTNAPVLRGAVQNTSGLTVSAPGFGPISPGASTPETVTGILGGAGALSGQTLKVVSNFDNVGPQTISVTGAAYDLANPVVTTTQPIAFGNVHVNATVTPAAVAVQNKTITNAAFQEGLDGKITGTGSGLTTNSGSFTNLAAGNTNSSAITVGIDTKTAGSKSGNLTLGFTSNGSTTSGLASTPLTAQNVAVTGAVYNLASSNTIAPINFGVLHVGQNSGSVTEALTITNTAPTGSFSEGLNSSFGSYTGSGSLTPTFAGSITNQTAGATDSTSMTAKISTATAGSISGNITVHQASNGTIDGLANTPLADQTPAVSGSVTATVTNLAVPVVNNTQPISFGNVRINTATTAQAVSVTNGAPVSSFSEGLIGSANGTTGTGIIAAGGFGSAGNSLAAGQTNPGSPTGSGNISVNIDTTSAGAKSGNAVLDFKSDGTGFSGGTVTDLGNTNVAVTGNVYRLANPTINTPSVTLAARVGGGLPSATISVTNTSPDAFTEGLNASLSSPPGTGFTNVGSAITNLAQGATDSTTLKVGLASTATSGTITGNASVALASNGTGTDGAANKALTSGTVALTGKVYQTAAATVTPSVNFGTVHVGDTVTAQPVNVANTAKGTLTDVITGSITSVVGPATNGGGTLGTGVAAGTNSNALTVGLNTSKAGTFTGGNAGSATLTLASHDADLADAPISTSPVTVSAVINNYASIGLANATKGNLIGGNAAYTLNFGNVTKGTGLLTAALDLLNNAAGPADALSMLMNGFTVKSGTGFSFSSGAFNTLAAGGSDQGDLSVQLDTATAGVLSETIQLDGTGTNVSGWNSGVGVNDPTLTITADVVTGVGAVPEPPSLLVMLAGLFGLGAFARRGRRSRTS